MPTLAQVEKVTPRRGTLSAPTWRDQGTHADRRDRGPTLARRLLPRLVADILAVSVGLAIFWVWGGRPAGVQILFALGYVLITALADAFHVRLERGYVEEFVLAVKVAVVALLISAVGGFLIDRPLSRVLFLSLALTMVVTRPIAARLIDRLVASSDRPGCVLAVCSAAEYNRLVTATAEHRSASQFVHVPVASLRPASNAPREASGGGAQTIAEMCSRMKATKVAVGSQQLTDPELRAELARLNEQGVAVSSVARIFEADFGVVPLTCIDSSWFLFDLGPQHRLGYRFGRRLVDLVASVIFAFALAILLPFVAIAVRLDSTRPHLLLPEACWTRWKAISDLQAAHDANRCRGKRAPIRGPSRQTDDTGRRTAASVPYR